jgi:DNA-binding response OmpR family regulator
VFTREELLRDVWGYRTPSRTVDSHACRLRNKLSDHPQRLVINVWGVDYRLCDPISSGRPGHNAGDAMSAHRRQPLPGPQPTCCQRRSSGTNASTVQALEISHACRLRRKLSSDTHRLVINVWGVGYRLIDQ